MSWSLYGMNPHRFALCEAGQNLSGRMQPELNYLVSHTTCDRPVMNNRLLGMEDSDL
jgi:hypothetical protein